jgi:FkbM family methyltransferase
MQQLGIKSRIHRIIARLLSFLPIKVVPTHRLKAMRQSGLRRRVALIGQQGFTSQYGQDVYIYQKFFREKKLNATFVDIGAYDGVTFSNTAFFEKELGWNGILIEPNPIACARAEANRTAKVLCCGVGGVDATLDFLQCEGYGAMLSCFKDFAAPDHLARIEAERLDRKFETTIMKIPVRAISDILTEHGIDRIDLLSIDVEGAEIDILKCFPFGQVSIEVCSVEVNGDGVFLEQMMNQHALYLAAVVGTDHIYVARKHLANAKSNVV